MRDEFTLTGSDRPADVAAAAGQQDIFGGAPAAPAPAPAAKPTPRRLTDQEAFADAFKRFEGRELKQSVHVQSTGQTATLTADAAKAMRDIDGRQQALRALMNCLEAR